MTQLNIQYAGGSILIDVEYAATIQDVLDKVEEVLMGEYGNCTLFYNDRPLILTDTLADLGFVSQGTLDYRHCASWSPTEREMREAIKNYDEMEIYHPGGDRDIRYWDTSNVTDMGGLFKYMGDFNEDIGGWNVSNVTNMCGMFVKASTFNADIRRWNTSKVRDMSGMFMGASAFNADIGEWDTSNVMNMSAMFLNAPSFNQHIGEWDTSNVTNMSGMFNRAKLFNADIGRWDTSRVTDMDNMFHGASEFNQEIGMWNTSKVESMSFMFARASAFRADISKWDMSSVRDMNNMFHHAESFNQSTEKLDTPKAEKMDVRVALPPQTPLMRTENCHRIPMQEVPVELKGNEKDVLWDFQTKIRFCNSIEKITKWIHECRNGEGDYCFQGYTNLEQDMIKDFQLRVLTQQRQLLIGRLHISNL